MNDAPQDTRTVAELEESLRDPRPEQLAPARLAEIRSQGDRRRRTHLAGVGAGVAAALVVAAVGVGAVVGGGAGDADRGRDVQPAAPSRHEMDPLAQRALAEVPGARQVSDWQVLLPRPDGARPDFGMGDQHVPADLVDAGPVDIGTRDYSGVTSYREGAFPAWLWDGIADYEKTVLGSPEDGYPVGSTDIGVVVDGGQLRLACMRPLPEWGGGRDSGQCFPAMVSGDDGDLAYAWGMGTDDFLHQGEDLELFHTDTYVAGTPQTVWIGGTYGTDVASVDLVTTDGDRVEATVASGTLVPGDTMFWGTVDGTLAKAVTRDADGRVLEEHEVKPCSDPVDCEVR